MIRYFQLLLLTCMFTAVSAQDPADSSRAKKDDIELDDLEGLEDLLRDLDLFLDSLLAPRSYWLISASMNPGYYNYKATGLTRIRSVATPTYSPMLAYYHRSGLGLTGNGYLMNDEGKLNFYQWSISPSFDYLANPNFATGISYTHYFSKDSVPFYVSPLNNEISAYFTWRKSWLRPAITASYAWGSREQLNMRLAYIQRLWLRRRLANWLRENYEDNISDFSVTASVLHDFYWLAVIGKKDHIRVTPQFLFTAGTQQFGMNQRGTYYNLNNITRANLLSTAREFNLDAKRSFEPLSASFSLRAEYGIGAFFVQPQFLLDYYFPANEKPWSALFSVTAGFSF
ncbi:MAG: hypothetical protein ACK4E0_15840 [Chitinophagaceae bacterium]